VILVRVELVGDCTDTTSKIVRLLTEKR